MPFPDSDMPWKALGPGCGILNADTKSVEVLKAAF